MFSSRTSAATIPGPAATTIRAEHQSTRPTILRRRTAWGPPSHHRDATVARRAAGEEEATERVACILWELLCVS